MRRPAVFAVGILAVRAALAGGDAVLLPPSGAVAGLSRDGAPRVFTGAELYGHIDGGAEIFFEFGFESLTLQRYAGPAGTLVLECYRMSDPTAALGVYLGRCGEETPDRGLPERHTVGRHQLMLVRDRFFATVYSPAGTPASARALVELARSLAARLPDARPVRPFHALPGERLVPGSERLIRGPVALEAIATLGRGDVLSLGGRLTAVAGEYENEGGRTALVVVTYDEPDAARRALSHLSAALDPEITALEVSENRLIFRDYDGTFGLATLTGARLEIGLHLRKRPASP